MAARTDTLPPPPSNIALEAAVLGAMLLERSAVSTVLGLLRDNADVFYPVRHRHVFRAIQALHASGQAIDQLTVVHELLVWGKLEQAGGVHVVTTLTMQVQNAINLSSHCTILLDLYAKRRTAEIAHELLRTAYDISVDAGDVLASAQRHLNALYDTRQVRRARTQGELFHGAIDEIVAATKTPGGVTGVPSGLTALDNITGGWQPGDLVIIAARPGMGKTSLTLGIANLAEAADHWGLFCSLEMSTMQLVKKSIATATGKTTSQLTRGLWMTPAEAEDLRIQAGALASSRLLIDDTPALSIGDLRAKATKAVADCSIKIIYVDYLQLMTGDKGGNREQEIGSISRGLKMIAKELHLPVIALAQLSRAVETRGGDKKPQLSDLRESGSIEQDADVVIFPHRPEYYGTTQDSEGNSTAGLTELIIAKQRNGSLGNPIVRSNMATGKYQDLDKDKPYLVPAPYSAGALPMSIFKPEKPGF